jgi:hypothetical protein
MLELSEGIYNYLNFHKKSSLYSFFYAVQHKIRVKRANSQIFLSLRSSNQAKYMAFSNLPKSQILAFRYDFFI